MADGELTNKQAEERLKTLQQTTAANEALMASMTKQLEIMKLGGVHHTKRKQLAEELIKLEQEMAPAMQEQADLADKINQKGEQRAKIQKSFMASLAAINELVNMGVEAFQYQNDLTEGTANNLNIGVTEAMKMNKEFAAIAANSGGGFVTAEVVENFKALRDSIGDSSIATAELAGSMTEMSKSLKIGTNEAAMFYKQMTLSDGASQDMIESTLILGKNLADASGVNFQNVMADVAQSGKEFANFSGKSTKEVLKAAIAARKMGFELKDMVEMSQGLLDVEGRIEKQMKFNMLTGKNINLDKATSLMLAGKESEAMEEIKNQVGDTSDLGILERQALDELLGGKLTEMEQAQMKAEMSTIEADKTTAALEQMDAGLVKEDQRLQLQKDIATEMTKQQNFITNQKDLLAANTAEYVNQTGAAKALVGVQQALAMIQMAVAIAGIFSAFAQIPFGIGIPLAIAAVAGLSAMVLSNSNAVGAIGLAEGGVVEAKQGGTPAVIGEGGESEIVLPLSKAGGFVKEVANTMNNNTPAATLDIEPLLKKMDQLIAAVKSGRVLNVDGYQLNEALDLETVPSGVA